MAVSPATFVVNCITLTEGQDVILHHANRSRPATFLGLGENQAIKVQCEGQLFDAQDLIQGTLAPFCFA